MATSKATELTRASTHPHPSRRHQIREAKVIETAEQYTPAVSSDWDTAPTTQDGALDALAAGSVATAEVSGTLTTAQLLAMNATPIVAIAAPGAGKAIIVEEVELFLDFNAAAYAADAGEDLVVRYTTSAVAIDTWDDADTIIEGTGDERRLTKPDTDLDLDDADNESVEFAILVGEWATGDSPIKYRIKYAVKTLIT